MTYRHSETARAVLRSLVPVICPREAHGLADALVDHAELTLGSFPAVVAHGFATGIVAYDLGALPRYASRARFLEGDRAERYFASWERGITPLHGQLTFALNQLLSLACYEHPEIAAQINYQPGPWMVEVTKRRLTTYRDDVRRQEAQVLAPDPLDLRPRTERDTRARAVAEREPA